MDPFISTGDLGDYVGEDLSASNAAQIAIEGACDIVRTITEQALDFEPSDTVVLDGTGTDTLLLPGLPVNNVASVTEGTTVLTADDDYKLGPNGALHRMPGVIDNGWGTEQLRTYWWPGRQNVTVTYSHGYGPSELPNDLKMVTLLIAKRLLEQGAATTSAVEETESLGAYSHSTRYSTQVVASDLTIGERLILRKYKVAK